MSCKLHHEISIANLKNDEIIHHAVVLIRGSVTRCNVEHGCVEELASEEQKHFEISKVNGEFKVLWQLATGLNRFRLTYCTKVVDLDLIHQRPSTQHRIQPLYLVCQGHDVKKCDEEEACRKITLGLQLVQCLYAEKLLEHEGLGRKTFTLNSDCVSFRSSLNVKAAKELDENSLWNEFGREILNSSFGDDEKLKFVAFIGCTEYKAIADGDFSYENIKRHTKANANLGGGGLALFGSGYLYCWPSHFLDIVPCFESKQKIDLERFLDDSNYRRTYGGCFASTIGALCHELGHIFDLGHTEEGIMGNGFDYVNLVFTSKHLTENLPNRLVDTPKQQEPAKDRRLTSLKTPGQFLQKYHEQKAGDSTFFTRNCAAILSLHRWLNIANSRHAESDNIQFLVDSDSTLVINCTSSYLKLIEIRDRLSNLVVDYLDLILSQENLHSVNLGNRADLKRHSLFVITSDGSTKHFP